MPSGDNASVDINVTALVKAWVAGSPNYGIMLRGASEEASSNRVELYSDDASSRQPRLIIDYTYEV
jgi:hypothetical protein